MSKLAILVVNYRGGKYVDLLLHSLSKTISPEVDYEVIIVNNFVAGYRAQTTLARWFITIKHYARILLKGTNADSYHFHRPPGMNITIVRTRPRPVTWSTELGIRGKAVSLSHAAGLRTGYAEVPSDSDFVLLLDQDVVFLKKNWLEDFLNHFQDARVVLVGVCKEERIYARPFLRPFCLMFRRCFYRDLEDPFTATPQGDTCSLLTYWCEDQGKKYHLFRNSLNNPELEDPALGEIAVDAKGEIFFVHRGHSTSHPNEQSWVDQMTARLESLQS